MGRGVTTPPMILHPPPPGFDAIELAPNAFQTVATLPGTLGPSISRSLLISSHSNPEAVWNAEIQMFMDRVLTSSEGRLKPFSGKTKWQLAYRTILCDGDSSSSKSDLLASSFLITPLTMQSEHYERSYTIEYEVLDAQGNSLWQNKVAGSVEGRFAGGAGLGRVGEVTGLMTELQKAITRESTVAILNDIYSNSPTIIAALEKAKRTELAKPEIAPQEAPPATPPETVSAPQLSPAASSRSSSWAVIVGISKYQSAGDSGLSNLVFADKDARDLAATLEASGWSLSNIRLLVNEDATKRNIEAALESWLTKSGRDDEILLYWSGHGFPDPEDPEKVYFACFDTDPQIPSTGYRMDRVRSALEERKARNVIVMADTCHAGKLITRGDGAVRSVGITLSETVGRRETLPPGWVFMVGAETDRQAIEHTSWSNGAFTHCLLRGMAGEADGYESVAPKDGVVTLGELREFLRTQMPEQTQKVLGVAKHPLITTNTGNTSIWNLPLTRKSTAGSSAIAP